MKLPLSLALLKMEGHHNMDISNSGGAGGASRWNPTKEQIDMLENLYKQGLRTPSADQIQQITHSLRSFGHIEGKNVFYWFQNHKARQRQKQKLDHVAYVNRFLHKSSAYSACPNALCSPFYKPYPELGLGQHQQQQPKVLLPRSFKRRPMLAERLEKNKPCGRALFDQANQAYNPIVHPIKASEECMNMSIHPRHYNKETLELFPMHPSGNLLQPASTTAPNSPVCSSSMGNCAAFSSSPFAPKCIADQGGSEDHAFFDFLCGSGSCDSH